jgi:hypothetical protein
MTIRTKTYLTGTTYVAGQAPGAITSAAHRDFVESVDSWIAPTPTALTSGTSITWATAGEKVNNATLTLAHNATLSITGAVAGAEGFLRLTQDGTGSRTFTLPAGTVIGSTTSVNATASKTTLIAWFYDGTTMFFVLSQQA